MVSMVVYAQRVSQDQNAPTRWSGDVIGRHMIELANSYCVYGKMLFLSSLCVLSVTQKLTRLEMVDPPGFEPWTKGLLVPCCYQKNL